MKGIRPLKCRNGMTVMEVVIAVVVLTFVVGSLSYGIMATDKQRAVRLAKSQASILAANELERLERQAALVDSIADTVYEIDRAGIRYEVVRSTVHEETEYGVWGEPDEKVGPRIQEIQIEVKRGFDSLPLVRYRLAHGFMR